MSEMLDSRAIVLLAAGKPEQALADTQRALAERSSPACRFHQAMALEQLGRKTAAGEAFEQAKQDGLKVEMLHAVERPIFERMQKEAQQPKPAGTP